MNNSLSKRKTKTADNVIKIVTFLLRILKETSQYSFLHASYFVVSISPTLGNGRIHISVTDTSISNILKSETRGFDSWLTSIELFHEGRA